MLLYIQWLQWLFNGYNGYTAVVTRDKQEMEKKNVKAGSLETVTATNSRFKFKYKCSPSNFPMRYQYTSIFKHLILVRLDGG